MKGIRANRLCRHKYRTSYFLRGQGSSSYLHRNRGRRRLHRRKIRIRCESCLTRSVRIDNPSCVRRWDACRCDILVLFSCFWLPGNDCHIGGYYRAAAAKRSKSLNGFYVQPRELSGVGRQWLVHVSPFHLSLVFQTCPQFLQCLSRWMLLMAGVVLKTFFPSEICMHWHSGQASPRGFTCWLCV